MKMIRDALSGAGLTLLALSVAEAAAPREIPLDSEPMADVRDVLAKPTVRQLAAPDEDVTGSLAAPRVERSYTAQAGQPGWRSLRSSKLEADEDSNSANVEQSAAVHPPAAREGDSEFSSKRPLNVSSVEEVVVTGTHIRGVVPVGSPVIVIHREQIEASGYGRVQDLLETLPQNFSGSASEDTVSGDVGASNETRGQAIDLRGLGASSTLVLVNGRRQPSGGLQGSFVDISSLALSAVERIEILTDGASALYGSDAIGGVVNFVLRKDYEGVESNVRISTTGGAATELQGSLLAGRRWASGGALAGYHYSERDALMYSDTPYGSRNRDFRTFGGSDFRSLGGNPGTITRIGQPSYAIPPGQDGTNLTAVALVPGYNHQDFVSGSDALPEQAVHSAFFTISQLLGDRSEVFTEGRYGQRRMISKGGGNNAVVSVPSTNPFYVNPYGGAGPVQVHYDFSEDLGGPLTQMSDTETASLATGIMVRLGQGWRLDATASYGREKNVWEFFNFSDPTRLSTCLSGLATSICPGSPFNVFGDGSNNDPATIDFIRGGQLGSGHSSMRALTAKTDGPVLRLPAGSALLAVGVDYRDERLRAARNNFSPTTGIVSPIAGATLGDMKRQVLAAFGELVVPILGGDDDPVGVPKLALSLATRYEDYSDFGSTANPKIGFNFKPTRDVTLRGTWGTSFRAPRFNEVNTITAPDAALSFSVADPLSPTGRSDVLLLTGGNPDLKEESADIWTLGFDLTPERLPGFSLAATYFSLDYVDKIQRAGQGVNTLMVESEWAEIITRNPPQTEIDAVCNSPGFNPLIGCPASVAAIIDIRIQNLAIVRARGIDLSLEYRTALPLGNLSFALGGVYNLEYERAVSSTATPLDVLDTVESPLALRARGSVGWEFKGWHVNGSVNYAGSYKQTTSIAAPSVGSWTTVDASVGYQFGKDGWIGGTALQFSALNLLDEEPPFVNRVLGYDNFNASQVGRVLNLSITKSW